MVNTKYLLFSLLVVLVAKSQQVMSYDFRVVSYNISAEQIFAIPSDTATPDRSDFGGISGLAYDDGRDVFYGLSDNHRNTGGSSPVPFHKRVVNPRFYTMRISNAASYEILNVTYLKSEAGVNFRAGEFQPKGIAYYDNSVYISYGEGTGYSRTGVWEFNLDGVKLAEFYLPPNIQTGILNSVAVTPSGGKLFAATEAGLLTDDPHSIRLTEFDRSTRVSTAQYVYQTRSNSTGLADLIALDDNGSFMTLESDGSVYYSLGSDASNVLYDYTLFGMNPTIVTKAYLAAILGGFEAMAMPILTNRSNTYNRLVFITNNNFINATNVLDTRVAIDTAIGVARPVEETEQGTEGGIAQDPAVWVNPNDPSQSLVIGTLMDGGLAVYNLTGHLLSNGIGNLVEYRTENGTGNRTENSTGYLSEYRQGQFLENRTVDYYSADVIYAFPLSDGTLIDVVVVSNGVAVNNTGTLSVFRISPNPPYLIDITNNGISTVGPTFEIATYTSPYTGKVFAFVSRGQEVLQIELQDGGSGFIEAVSRYNVRAMRLDSDIDGMVVDREIGSLYVSLLDGRIVKFDAEPDERNGDSATEVATSDNFAVRLQGLTMYYSGYRDGYLIASLASDSSFAVFDRNGYNDYIGSFTIGENRAIDQTDATQGIDIVNINLGPDFECGAFIAQDNDNDSTSIRNRNTNFKLVPYDELSSAMSDDLTIDTESWGPRRFALAAHVDALSSQVYCALKDGDISGRDAAELLDLLSDAAAHIYPPATKKRQIMEPYYLVRDKHGRSSSSSSSSSSSGSSSDSSSRRQRNRRTQSRCPTRSNSMSRSGENSRASSLLRNFMNLLRDLNTDDRLSVSSSTFNYWIALAGQVIWNMPAEIEYAS